MGQLPYTGAFYDFQRGGSRRSATIVVPLLLELLAPRSVIDVGCGVGTWLSVFRELGVAEVCGVDGDWVDRAALEFPAGCFEAADLAKPLRLNRLFDLVLSLEVAEHLPPESADTFVDSLSALGPAIVFSAAIPLQGGVNHVNEQWPEYWADRFAARGYNVVDAVRRRIWHESAVDWYYAQNMLIFVRPEALSRRPVLAPALDHGAGGPLSIVHPRQWESVVGWSRALVAAIDDVATAVPSDGLIVVADQAQCGAGIAAGRRALPFLERDGTYWGPPPDDVVAIEEMKRLRRRGAGFLVVAWPAFWWLEHYVGFRDYLRASSRCVVDNDRTKIFDLRPGGR
jgi:SAM-dependent methyltransferase